MYYFIPIATLAFFPAAFFIVAKGSFRSFGKIQRGLRIVVAIPLLVSSFGHFFRTAVFASIVPPVFPHPAVWVTLTGVMELAGAIGLLLPKTARAAAVCITLLMIAVFPANIYAANQTVGGLHMPGVPLRLAMQILYVLLVLVSGWGIPGRQTRK